MRKTSTSRSAFFSLRSLVTLVLCAAVACSVLTVPLLAFFRSEESAKFAHRTLTFEERVAYQRAIEEVYWRHRIWPKERPDPKPSLDTIMTQAQLQTKVTDYLRNSQALAEYWGYPITTEQLQAEMDRMAQHTKQSEVLRELFKSLRNDPFVIAECLARPVLAERLITELYAHDHRLHRTLETQVPVTMAAVTANYVLPAVASPSGGCTDDTWAPTSLTNTPGAREYHTAVWTGSEMIIWGGEDISGDLVNTGGRYNPSTDSWTATSTTNAPAARQAHTAVWTGSEMIVWGGNCFVSPYYFDTGGRYDPIADSWTATSTINAPAARNGHTAVWTGSEMIVWGGNDDNGRFNTGGRYNPSTDSWTATNTNAPEGRDLATAVWTGSEMIVWGGEDFIGNFFNTGGRYDPSTDSWTSTSTINAPAPRSFHTAVWTGSEMIVWGGTDVSTIFGTGGRYNPSSDTWTETSTIGAAASRLYHTAVWISSEMIVWGGYAGGGDSNTGGRYNPSTNGWTATSISNAPPGRSYHTAVWTGTEMIVWGGRNNFINLNTGDRYCAVPAPTPTPTPTATASPTTTPTATPTPSPSVTPSGTPSPTPIVITVTNTNDSGSGSLRQALADANHGDIIGFAVTGTIGLTSGELLVDKSITISGPGANNLAIDGNAKSPVFHIASDRTVTISGLTITKGYTTGFGGGIHNDHATLTLNNCAITGNSGGGIYNDAGYLGGTGLEATLEISNSSVRDNSGGGINNDAEGGGGVATLEITDSTLSNNNSGYAIYSHGWSCVFCGNGTATVRITNSSITGNSGGAIYSDTRAGGGVSLLSSTVSENSGVAVYGGTFASILVSNSTISENSGGGLYNISESSGSGVHDSTMSNNGTELSSDGGAFLSMENTVFNVSPGGHSIVSDGGGTIKSIGYNISSDDGGGYLTGPGDQINVDPLLGPLRDNGGPTFTHELLPGSPAINAGDPNFVPPPDYDQRGAGYYRVRNGRLDIGSFEVQQPLPRPSPTPRSRPSPPPRPTPH
jgi:N-acetylneuraminic acid mutarotase